MPTVQDAHRVLQDVPSTPYYCEENVYLQLQALSRSLPDLPSAVAFISSESRRSLLFQQRAALLRGMPYVVWDYHVVALLYCDDGDYVYDIDSLLPMPARLQGDHSHVPTSQVLLLKEEDTSQTTCTRPFTQNCTTRMGFQMSCEGKDVRSASTLATG